MYPVIVFGLGYGLEIGSGLGTLFEIAQFDAVRGSKPLQVAKMKVAETSEGDVLDLSALIASQKMECEAAPLLELELAAALETSGFYEASHDFITV